MRVWKKQEKKTILFTMVPMAEERRPEKGNESGERWHCALILMRPTMVLKLSTRDAASLLIWSEVKMALCWPFHDSLAAAFTSLKSLKVATGITGPNCSSRHSRMAGVTG